MRTRLRALYGAALAALLTGCDINLSDVTLSNIGNGNRVDANVDVGDVNVGNGGSGGSGGSGKIMSVALNRPHFRVRLGLDPRTMNDSHSQDGPVPDFELLEAAAVTAHVAYEGGGNFPLPTDSPDWKWLLPSSLERAGSMNGQPGFILVAKPGSATGSHVIRLESTKDTKIAATASVEILDGGSADVVLE